MDIGRFVGIRNDNLISLCSRISLFVREKWYEWDTDWTEGTKQITEYESNHRVRIEEEERETKKPPFRHFAFR